MPWNPADRNRWPGGCEHNQHDEQRTEEQEQPVLKLQPTLMFPRRGDEITNRREHDRGWLAPGQQMEENGDCRGCQPGQHPRMKKTDHAGREGGVSASRRTIPNGVSVVTR